MARVAKSQQTKKEIAASFEECLKHKPLDKITIIDITEDSGVSRQMFYHYFSDRMELIRWVCCSYVKEPLYADEKFTWEQSMQRLLSSKEEYGANYRNIIHSRYGRVLSDVLKEELYALYYCVIRYRICRTLPNELTDMLKQYCVDSPRLILEYYDDAEVNNVKAVIGQLFDIMPKQLQILICERAVSVKDIFAERRLFNWAYE